MKRIAVVGSPGAGKTTFVRKLGAKTGLPIVHLDFYYHQTEHDYYNNKEAWIARVGELINTDEWIMDGNYTSSLELRFERADTIIFFDVPRRVAMQGVMKRRIQYHNKLREEMPSDWTEKANLEFLRYVWGFKRDKTEKIMKAIKGSPDKKVIIFKNRKQADEYLKNL